MPLAPRIALVPALLALCGLGPAPGYAQQTGTCFLVMTDTADTPAGTLATRLSLRLRALSLECPKWSTTLSQERKAIINSTSPLGVMLSGTAYDSVVNFQAIYLRPQVWEHQPGHFDIVVIQTGDLYYRFGKRLWQLSDFTLLPSTAFWARDYDTQSLAGVADQVVDRLLSRHRGTVPIH